MRSSSLGRVSQSLLKLGSRSFSERVVQDSTSAKSRGLSAAAKVGITVPTLLIGSWVFTSKDPGTRAAIALQLPIRFARDVICAALITAGMIHLH